MIYLIQILNMLNKNQVELFTSIFEDLNETAQELEYVGHEADLVEEMLLDHFNIEMLDLKQIEMLTSSLLKNQGRLRNAVEGAMLLSNR